jgi:hypothetical protein
MRRTVWAASAVLIPVSLAGIVLAVTVLTAPTIPSTSDAHAIEQLIENEERDSIASIVFPTTGGMRYGDYLSLMSARVRALDHYYTRAALAENQAKLAPTAPSYPPEKVAAALAAGTTIPPLASSSPDSTFDPPMRPVAAAITGITWKSLAINGDSARVVAEVGSSIDYLMKSETPSTTVHLPTPAVMTFECRRMDGQWFIASVQIEYPNLPG